MSQIEIIESSESPENSSETYLTASNEVLEDSKDALYHLLDMDEVSVSEAKKGLRRYAGDTDFREKVDKDYDICEEGYNGIGDINLVKAFELAYDEVVEEVKEEYNKKMFEKKVTENETSYIGKSAAVGSILGGVLGVLTGDLEVATSVFAGSIGVGTFLSWGKSKRSKGIDQSLEEYSEKIYGLNRFYKKYLTE